jgi:hypothetical protein
LAKGRGERREEREERGEGREERGERREESGERREERGEREEGRMAEGGRGVHGGSEERVGGARRVAHGGRGEGCMADAVQRKQREGRGPWVLAEAGRGAAERRGISNAPTLFCFLPPQYRSHT